MTDEERRRPAVKGKALGRKVLEAVACIVTPDTILVWHRRLVALKWTFHRGRVGRPKVAHEVRDLIFEMARTEPRWGYTSIRERLGNLGHRVSQATVANILMEHGLEPAPKRSRQTSSSAFLKAQGAQRWISRRLKSGRPALRNPHRGSKALIIRSVGPSCRRDHGSRNCYRASELMDYD